MILRTATRKDTKELLGLDRKAFSEDWLVDEYFVYEILQNNNKTYRVLETDDGIKGYYGFFPLTKSPYEELLSGQLQEKHINYYVEDYILDKELYLYCAAVVVDIADKQNRKKYAEALIKDIPIFIKSLIKDGYKIKEIGSIAVTKAGVLLCRQMGMEYSHTLGLNSKVYRLSYEKLFKKLIV